jgi:hypothetical protein
MTNEEEFEKALQDYTSQHVTGSSGVGLIRKIGAHFYAARQPEIDALEALHFDALKEVNAERAKKAVLKAEVAHLRSYPEAFRREESRADKAEREIDALKAEVERLNRYIERRHAMMAPAVREASIAAIKETK